MCVCVAPRNSKHWLGLPSVSLPLSPPIEIPGMLWYPVLHGGSSQITCLLNLWICGVPTGMAWFHCLCRLLQPRHTPVVAGEPAALLCPRAL